MILKRLKQLLRWIKNRLFKDNLDDNGIVCPACGATKFNLYENINKKVKFIFCPSCNNLYFIYYKNFHRILNGKVQWIKQYYYGVNLDGIK